MAPSTNLDKDVRLIGEAALLVASVNRGDKMHLPSLFRNRSDKKEKDPSACFVPSIKFNLSRQKHGS